MGSIIIIKLHFQVCLFSLIVFTVQHKLFVMVGLGVRAIVKNFHFIQEKNILLHWKLNIGALKNIIVFLTQIESFCVRIGLLCGKLPKKFHRAMELTLFGRLSWTIFTSYDPNLIVLSWKLNIRALRNINGYMGLKRLLHGENGQNVNFCENRKSLCSEITT